MDRLVTKPPKKTWIILAENDRKIFENLSRNGVDLARDVRRGYLSTSSLSVLCVEWHWRSILNILREWLYIFWAQNLTLGPFQSDMQHQAGLLPNQILGHDVNWTSSALYISVEKWRSQCIQRSRSDWHPAVILSWFETALLLMVFFVTLLRWVAHSSFSLSRFAQGMLLSGISSEQNTATELSIKHSSPLT